ncbi:BRO [Orgyia pseudotsugata single capsid nuclopolyhedrovirus]|nr:BRO [Orgyia pseudotsugata single capsid nuclopolyhedrovirus]
MAFDYICKLLLNLFKNKKNNDDDNGNDKGDINVNKKCKMIYNDNDDDDDNIKSKNLPIVGNGYSYLFSIMTLSLNNELQFDVRYFTTKSQIWMVGNDFARGLGFRDPHDALGRYVEFQNSKPANRLLFDSASTTTTAPQITCINKQGAFQLINNINFDNKAEFVIRFNDCIKKIETNVKTSTSSSPASCATQDKLDLVMQAIDVINKSNVALQNYNVSLKTQIVDKFDTFNVKIAELDKKLQHCNTVDRLYDKLRKHHKVVSDSQAPSSLPPKSVDGLSFLDEHPNFCVDNNNDDVVKYDTVRFPKNAAKHPRLAVFVKADHDGTHMSFLAGQQKNINARKRNYQDMELIYDHVHPNPIMAVHCIDEELHNKKYSFCKRGKRTYHVECDVDTIKSFINEVV